MFDDEENGSAGIEHIGRITAALAQALTADAVSIKLQNGREIAGSLAGYSIRKKESKKGEVNWSGNVKIQTEPGVLQIDILDINTITSS